MEPSESKSSITAQKTFYDLFLSQDIPINFLQTARCGAILTELSRLELWTPRILDFGCGDGWLTSVLSMFGEAMGADLSPDVAAKRFPGIRFVEADFNKWTPNLAPFDVVISQEVIEHLEDQRRYIETAADLLRPAGYFILTTPNARVTEAWRGNRRLQPIENVLAASELRKLLAHRFELISLRTILVGPGKLGLENAWTGIHWFINSTRLRAALSRMGMVRNYDRALESLGFGLHLVATAKKL